jgi:hypothetical protein
MRPIASVLSLSTNRAREEGMSLSIQSSRQGLRERPRSVRTMKSTHYFSMWWPGLLRQIQERLTANAKSR